MTRDEYMDAHGEDMMRCHRCRQYAAECDCMASDDHDPADDDDDGTENDENGEG